MGKIKTKTKEREKNHFVQSGFNFCEIKKNKM